MMSFRADTTCSQDVLRTISGASPENPFLTPAYAAARAARGDTVVSFGLEEAGATVEGCFGFLSQGWRSRSLEIPSVPDLAYTERFWAGVTDWCTRNRIATLRVPAFASNGVPVLGGTALRRERQELILDLDVPVMWHTMSVNHQRNVKRAEKKGLTLAPTIDPVACEIHVRLMASSMTRRANRGERVSPDVDAARLEPFLRLGAGEIFQGIMEGTVVSSLLVLVAARGAYYHSAGTSPEGMAAGASHFLVKSTVDLLRSRGMTLFNLGGAGATEEGLLRFKTGFGARAVHPQAIELSFGRSASNLLSAAVFKLRDALAVSIGRNA
jgi:hypothetical protein